MSSTTSSAAIRTASRSCCCTAVPGRVEREDAPFPRSGEVPDRAVRPARRGPFNAARRPGRQHHLGPGRRHREAARKTRHRALAGVRRLVGLDARAGLCRNPSAARRRTGPARHLHAAPLGAGVVLPGGRQPPVPGGVGALHRCDPAGGAPRPDLGLPPPPDQQRRVGAAGGRARLERMGRGDQFPARGPGLRQQPPGTRTLPWPSPASRTTISSMAGSSRSRTSCCATRTGSPAFPA